jgi:hypothetical protein
MTRGTRVAVALAAAGVAGALLGAFFDPERALLGWLAAVTGGLGVTLGALLLVLVCDAAGAVWFVVVRPVALAVAGALPVFVLLFVPIAFGVHLLYPWAWPDATFTSEELAKIVQARQWLTPPLFVVRAILYLCSWLVLLAAARRAAPGARQRIGAVGTLVVGLTGSFAAFEWIMSLQVGWGSTIFGLAYVVGAFLGGTSAVALAAEVARRRGVLAEMLRPDHFHALGRLLIVGVSLWSYCAFSQLLLIWIANLPREVPFYVVRGDGAWWGASVFLIAFRFALPLFLLLQRRVTRNPVALAGLAGWILFTQIVDAAWLVFPGRAAAPSIPDAAAMIAVASLVWGHVLRALSRGALFAKREPDLVAALGYESP